MLYKEGGVPAMTGILCATVAYDAVHEGGGVYSIRCGGIDCIMCPCVSYIKSII